ncbi:GNAT family N-acetyltransferase [Yoonia sp.]|uniref:GNAT family N-acetyltransferase n=1 Tax=Yoonia sp. TaxID=2212373 RepID=UPI002FDB6A36
MIPTLYTERLTLRPYQRSDFDTYAAFMGSPQSVHMGGPFDAEQAWAWFTNDIATWPLYGFGTLAVEFQGTCIGGVGMVYPPHFPEPECGWMIFEGFTGKGFAQEAGRRMLDHTFATTDLASIVSYVSVENTASIKVATNLGGTLDPVAAKADGDGEDTYVFRHVRRAA